MIPSYTTGTLDSTLIAVRCAHRPCLTSGRGLILCELSAEHTNVTVTALPRQMPGFKNIEKCAHCGGYNGIQYELRQAA